MPKPLQPITLSSPGFWGVNTEDPPALVPQQFAKIASNAVIDEAGRIACRGGVTTLTTGGADPGDGCEQIFEFVADDATKTVFSTGNNKIFTGTTSLTDVTPGSPSITANNWKIISFNNEVLFFQRGHEPLVYDPSVGTVDKHSGHTGGTGTAPQGHAALAAFGRVWAGDISGDGNTLYWTDALNGAAWTGGSSGSIDLSTVWPLGSDSIVGLAEHNDFLIIFGKRSILIYSGASSPSSMTLNDSISNVGCSARDSIWSIGSDILFLDKTGVRSLGRTIQEKSSPIGDISRNVNEAVKKALENETGDIKSVYNQRNSFYLITFPSQQIMYCFNTRYPLEDGSFIATTWAGVNPLSMASRDDGGLYLGNSSGIAEYDTSYTDDGSSYEFRWYSHQLSFGQAALLKFLKSIEVLFEGGQGHIAQIKWAYDYATGYRSQSVSINDGTPSEYGSGEYGVSEYSESAPFSRKRVNTGGSGNTVSVGVTVTVSGKKVSLQEINIKAILGRVL